MFEFVIAEFKKTLLTSEEYGHRANSCLVLSDFVGLSSAIGFRVFLKKPLAFRRWKIGFARDGSDEVYW